MAELRVGFGAELFAPKSRFILEDGFRCSLGFVLFLISSVITPMSVIKVVPPYPPSRIRAKLRVHLKERFESSFCLYFVGQEKPDGTCIGLRGSWSVVSLRKDRVSRLNPDGGELVWLVTGSLDGGITCLQ